MLAHIAVAKYQDAFPLYRYAGILGRNDIELPCNTLADWIIKAGELIQPLINLLQERLFDFQVLHCDETTVQVLKEPAKEAWSQSYMWLRVGGSPTQSIKLFHYADSRSSDVARHLLGSYRGYVQTDDYAGYNGACSDDNITQLDCWAHDRRKFIEAQNAHTTQKKTGKADVAISMMAKLYAIEKQGLSYDANERYRLRQTESIPQLDSLREWLDKTRHTV